jgi:hypothetical protein
MRAAPVSLPPSFVTLDPGQHHFAGIGAYCRPAVLEASGMSSFATDRGTEQGPDEVGQHPAVFVALGLCKTYGKNEAAVHALRNLSILKGGFVVLGSRRVATNSVTLR